VTRADTGPRTTGQSGGLPTGTDRRGEVSVLTRTAGSDVVAPSEPGVAGVARDGVNGARSSGRPDTRGLRPAADTDVATSTGGARVPDGVRSPEVVDRQAFAPVGGALLPPAEGGSLTVPILAATLLAMLLVVAGATVSRHRLRPSLPAGTRRRGGDRGPRPAAAPPSHAAGPATLVARPAPAGPAPAVPAPTLWAGTVSVEARRVRAAHAAQLAASEVAAEARIAGSCLPAMPTMTAVALLLLGGGSTVSAVDGAALAAAAALTVLGVRSTWRLPVTASRAFGRAERRLDGQQRDLDHVREALGVAKLVAVGGHGAAAAIDVGGSADHPMPHTPTSGSSLLPRGGDRSMLDAVLRTTEGVPGATGVAALARFEAQLHRRQRDVHHRRLQLVRVRAVGPFLVCALPATALVVAALAA
jgi:hypothetical protein